MNLLKRLTFTQLSTGFFILLLIALAGSLSTIELRAEEPRRAIVAMEMIMRQEWLVPRIHGANYYNKPPLFNWLIAGVFILTGSFSEAAVRIPSLFAFLLTAYLLYRVVKQYTSRQTGIVAAMLLLCSADILFYGAVNTGEIDLFFMLLVFLQAIGIFHYSRKEQWLHLFVFSYVATAAGVLTKFLPALLFQAVALLVWFIYIRQWKKLFSIQHLAGIACCLILSGLYFYLYSTRADVEKFLVNLINESTQQSALESDRLRSLLTFLQSPFILFYISLPGSLLFLYAGNKTVRATVKRNPLFQFALLFFLFNIPVYIITSKIHNRYLYPLFPFIIIMAACLYEAAVSVNPLPNNTISYKAIVSICLLMVLARIGYNTWIIPYQQKTAFQLSFRKLVTELAAITKDNPIHITGKPDTLLANPSLPFIHIPPDTLLIPPFIQPQVPYYCMMYTKSVVQYDPVPKKNVFYIVPESDLPAQNVTVYHHFKGWQNRPFALAMYY